MTNNVKSVTEHTTGVGELVFMAAARPIGEPPKYSIKIALNESDPAIEHLQVVSPKKVDTPTNRGLKGSGTLQITFDSDYAPVVTDAEGNLMESTDIPYFDGRTDTGKALISYTVKEYTSGKTCVFLAGVSLLELELAPRESQTDTAEVTRAKLQEAIKNAVKLAKSK